MMYGYARCSTNEKKQDVKRQIRELNEMGADIENIYFEYESGTNVDRLELKRLFEKVKQGDVIVTTEVSRLSRSTSHLCEILNEVKNKRIKLIIKNSITVDCTKGQADPMTEAFLQISGVFAELERKIISDRVKSGIDNARAKGKKIGRKPTCVDDIPLHFKKAYNDYYIKDKISKTMLARMTELSRPTVDKYIKILECST